MDVTQEFWKRLPTYLDDSAPLERQRTVDIATKRATLAGNVDVVGYPPFPVPEGASAMDGMGSYTVPISDGHFKGDHQPFNWHIS